MTKRGRPRHDGKRRYNRRDDGVLRALAKRERYPHPMQSLGDSGSRAQDANSGARANARPRPLSKVFFFCTNAELEHPCPA